MNYVCYQKLDVLRNVFMPCWAYFKDININQEALWQLAITLNCQSKQIPVQHYWSLSSHFKKGRIRQAIKPCWTHHSKNGTQWYQTNWTKSANSFMCSWWRRSMWHQFLKSHLSYFQIHIYFATTRELLITLFWQILPLEHEHYPCVIVGI